MKSKKIKSKKIKTKKIKKCFNSLKLNSFNQRGQQFEVFKLFIAVIMALAILMIILNSLGYFQSLSVAISQTRIIDGLKNAMKAPDVVSHNDPLIVKNVTLNEKIWTALELSQASGLKQECIFFDARTSAGSAFKLENLNQKLIVNKDIVSNVFIYCTSLNPLNSNCAIECTLSFGKVPVLSQ